VFIIEDTSSSLSLPETLRPVGQKIIRPNHLMICKGIEAISPIMILVVALDSSTK
jgi:hypothetical protein